ncbi:MAG: SIMPL domain-containing protein [Acidimicrobiales bacterium]
MVDDDDEGVVLSVRGEARRMVTPDAAKLSGSVTARREGREQALAAAASALDRLTGELAGLGGTPLRGSERTALTWSAFSATSHTEWLHDKETGRSRSTGQVVAAVDVSVTARALELLGALGAVLARQDDFDVWQVSWEVDDDNPQWAAVRSDAVAAALSKGRDYAAALGASLRRVEHVADAGLLAGAGDQVLHRGFSSAARAAGGDGEPSTPSLDPLPQELIAVVEARLRTSPATLPG